jgi:hypothetical protein
MSPVVAVEAVGALRPGLEGDLVLVGRLRARFEIIDVNDLGPSWTWSVRLGPVRLRMEQRVDEGFGLIEATGTPLAVLAYVPFARRSLSRLLRRGAKRSERARRPSPRNRPPKGEGYTTP